MSETWYPGRLSFYSETGTEGGYWAFEADGYSHGAEFDCGPQHWCPVRHGWHEHSSYEGLYVLRDGDGVQIPGDGVRVEHLHLPPHQTDQYAEDAYAFGILASHFEPPLDVDPAVWEKAYVDGARALVRPTDDSWPRFPPGDPRIWQ